MLRRLLYFLPVFLIFVCGGVVVMAARAPRTWSSDWTSPSFIATGSGPQEYGAVLRGPRRWDLLWVDDVTQRLLYRPAGGRTRAIQDGSVLQPSLLRIGGRDIGVWVRNDNEHTEMDAAVLGGRTARIIRLLDGPQPVEHPDLFAEPGGKAGLIFSWQRHGNFDLYLAALNPSAIRSSFRPFRLTHAEYYSFYPRAVYTGGVIDVLHLESCCVQSGWNVQFDRFSRAGRHLAATRNVLEVRYANDAPDPDQWPEALSPDGTGGVWGAFGGTGSGWLIHVTAKGRLYGPVSLSSSGDPTSMSVVGGRRGGVVVWEQPYSLGSYLASRQFTASSATSGYERIEYVSGQQQNPHLALLGSRAEILWQTSTHSGATGFEVADRASQHGPTLAQRLGLGLGNPWEALSLFVLGAFALATVATTANVIAVVALAGLGMLLLKVLRGVPGRWSIWACLLTFLLYAAFVTPGGPLLFLMPFPDLGLPAKPFGVLAAAAVLICVAWLGQTVLRRVEDVYRAAIMAIIGVYFFAFIEAVVFVQQRLGFI